MHKEYKSGGLQVWDKDGWGYDQACRKPWAGFWSHVSHLQSRIELPTEVVPCVAHAALQRRDRMWAGGMGSGTSRPHLAILSLSLLPNWAYFDLQSLAAKCFSKLWHFSLLVRYHYSKVIVLHMSWTHSSNGILECQNFGVIWLGPWMSRLK